MSMDEQMYMQNRKDHRKLNKKNNKKKHIMDGCVCMQMHIKRKRPKKSNREGYVDHFINRIKYKPKSQK